LHASEELQQTEIRGILLAAPRTADYALLCRVIDQLTLAALAKDVERALATVARLVPEYQPAVHENGGLPDATPLPLRPRSPGESEVEAELIPSVS
jgi:hypothetical protein